MLEGIIAFLLGLGMLQRTNFNVSKKRLIAVVLQQNPTPLTRTEIRQIFVFAHRNQPTVFIAVSLIFKYFNTVEPVLGMISFRHNFCRIPLPIFLTGLSFAAGIMS